MTLTNKYIILKRNKAVVPTMENLGMRARPTDAFAEAPDSLELVEAELTIANRNDLRKDPRTRAIALPMPMKLIAPVKSQDVSAHEAQEIAWGIRAVGALESPFDGAGITAAVLDTGIDPNHPAFNGVQLIRRNFTEESDDDQHGHGTHCAGTIFGRDVGNTRIGVATGVQRALIGKVLGQGGGYSSTIAQAIQWAVQEGAHVISMSLGIDFPGYVDYLVNVQGLNVNPATSIALEAYRANVNLFSELADFVRAQGGFLGGGTVIVAASGNESNRPEYEIAVAPPAAARGVVSVGALQQTASGLSTAFFSNNQVDVSAPGVNVVSAKMGGGLASMSGTSMATPHVAGIACMWAHQQLQSSGMIDGQRLLARLIACGSMSPMTADAQAEDVGTGIVQAPRG
jgi:subtilisin family serine protease